MFKKIKETVKSEPFRTAVKETAINIGAVVVTTLVVKAVVYGVTKGAEAVFIKASGIDEIPE